MLIDLISRGKSFYVVAPRQSGKSTLVHQIASYLYHSYKSVAVFYPNYHMVRQHNKKRYEVLEAQELLGWYNKGLHAVILDDFDMMAYHQLDTFMDYQAPMKIAFASPPIGGLWEQARFEQRIYQMEQQGIIGVDLNGKEKDYGIKARSFNVE